jgi:hypothetical protein
MAEPRTATTFCRQQKFRYGEQMEEGFSRGPPAHPGQVIHIEYSSWVRRAAFSPKWKGWMRGTGVPRGSPWPGGRRAGPHAFLALSTYLCNRQEVNLYGPASFSPASPLAPTMSDYCGYEGHTSQNRSGETSAGHCLYAQPGLQGLGLGKGSRVT